MNEVVLYTTEDGRSQIKLQTQEQTVWLTQLEMAELFDATKQNISLHLKNFFEDGELDPAATVKESLTVQIEGARKVQRPVKVVLVLSAPPTFNHTLGLAPFTSVLVDCSSICDISAL